MRVFKRKWIDKKTGEERESAEWHLAYTLNGRPCSHKTSPPTTNRRVAEEQLRHFAVGAFGGLPTTASVADVIDNHARHLQREAITTWRANAIRVMWWKTRYGTRDISLLTLDEIGRATVELRKGRKPGTVFGYLTMLRAAINRAILDGMISAHPASRLEIKDRSPKRRTLFPWPEVERVCARLPEWAAGVVRVARSTGIRIGDILSLRWDNVQGDRVVWTMQKGGKDREVPLTTVGRSVFAALPRSDSPLVFPRKAEGRKGPAVRWDKQAFYKVWWPALEAEGLSKQGPAKLHPVTGRRVPNRVGKTFHDLRRAFASDVLNAGASMPEVAALLGQESTSVTDHYTVHEMERLRQVAERAVQR